jgi:hypothetical protein
MLIFQYPGQKVPAFYSSLRNARMTLEGNIFLVIINHGAPKLLAIVLFGERISDMAN